MERVDPRAEKRRQEEIHELLKKQPPRKQETCLECNRPTVPGSRYCAKHYEVYTRKATEDEKSGKARTKNYAYSDSGFNEGLNAYVHDKDHFKQLSKKLKESEHLENY